MKSTSFKTHTVDYVVVGTGIAGLSAARKLAEAGQQVALLAKSEFQDGCTAYAQGGIAAVWDPKDSIDSHIEDTCRAGDGLCDPERVRLMVEAAPKCIEDLITLGAQFSRNESGIMLSREAAHQFHRVIHAADTTGKEIHRVLKTACLQADGVDAYEHMRVIDLLVNEDGHCTGCIAERDGVYHQLIGKAVILATGGAAALFSRHSNPMGSTGDGIIMAYKHGAVLQDLELVQFHPTTLYTGTNKGPAFLLTEALRGEGAQLCDAAGTPFMSRYHADADLAPRNIVSRAIFEEMQSQGVAHVYLDLRPIGKQLSTRFPMIYARCKKEGYDPDRSPIPVSPAAHYCMGGVQSDEWGHSTVPGLYVVGEIAATSVHGANRLASNSLLEGMVFGERAAKDAVQRYPSTTLGEGSLQTISGDPMIVPKEVFLDAETRAKLQELMWTKAGIVRDAEGLNTALRQCEEWEKDYEDGPVPQLLTLAKLFLDFALSREESRGGHIRRDFPGTNTEARHLYFQKDKEQVLA